MARSLKANFGWYRQCCNNNWFVINILAHFWKFAATKSGIWAKIIISNIEDIDVDRFFDLTISMVGDCNDAILILVIIQRITNNFTSYIKSDIGDFLQYKSAIICFIAAIWRTQLLAARSKNFEILK